MSDILLEVQPPPTIALEVAPPPLINLQTAAQQGPAGIQGPVGPEGPVGPTGSGGDLHYVHDQSTPASLWTITHNLVKFPAIATLDSSGSEVEGLVTHVTNMLATVEFSAAFSGTAYCN